MKRVSVSEAKKNLPALLSQAGQGEPTLITRRGKPVGALIDSREYDSMRKLRAHGRMLRLAQELETCGVTATELHRESRRELSERA